MDPRDIDAEIAEKIFGWQEYRVGADIDGENYCTVLVPPSGAPKGFQWPSRGMIHRAYMVPRYHFDLFEAIKLANHVGLRFASDIPTWPGEIAAAAVVHWRATHPTNGNEVPR